MKGILLLTIFISIYSIGVSQESKKSGSESLLKELAENGCKCVDTINTINKNKS
jgi:hypothetical protein